MQVDDGDEIAPLAEYFLIQLLVITEVDRLARELRSQICVLRCSHANIQEISEVAHAGAARAARVDASHGTDQPLQGLAPVPQPVRLFTFS